MAAAPLTGFTPADQLYSEVNAAITSGDYTKAFQLAQQQQVGMMAGTHGQGADDSAQSVGRPQTGFQKTPTPQPNAAYKAAYGNDPTVLSLLESSQGLSALAPGKSWTQDDVNKYYAAAQAAAQGAVGAKPGTAASFALGSNPTPTSQGGNVTLWGDLSKFSGDATADWAANPGKAPNLEQFAGSRPGAGSFLERYAIPIFDAAYLGIATAGIGSGIGAAVGGGLGGAAAGGAAAGAAGSALNAGLTGGPLTLKGVGTGALTGAVGGLAASALSPASTALANSTGINQSVANGIVKGVSGAATGALGAEIRGGNPLNSALAGGAAGLASGTLGSATGSSAVGNIAGNLVSRGVNSALAPSNNNMAVINPNTNGVNATVPQGTDGSGNVLGGLLQSGVGLGTTLLGTAGSAQAGSAVGNVLSNAQAGTGVGTNTGYSGPNSTGTIQSGQVNNQLTGGLNLANTGLGQAAAGSAGLANAQNGQLPQNVNNAINQQAQQNSQVPQGTQGQLNQQLGLQGQVQGSQFGLINSGTQQLNNPLTQNLQNAAQTQLNTAGQDFNTTYQNSLNSLNAALVNPMQNAEAELANTQFGRGQLGTSGGALQTQAFATGLGQAYMGNQQTAYNEALNAQNSATANAATLNNSANNNLSTANGLLANAYGQFNNTSQLNSNTANSIFGQNSSISQLANQYGQQNVGNQITAAQLPASLTGQNISNANAAISGAGNLSGIANAGTAAALAAGTQQGQQYNGANQVSSNVLNSSGFSQTGGNPYGAIGAGLNAALGSNGVAGGIGNALSGLGSLLGIGGGSNYNDFGTQQTGDASNYLQQQDPTYGQAPPTFDFSNIGNQDQYGLGGFDYDPYSYSGDGS